MGHLNVVRNGDDPLIVPVRYYQLPMELMVGWKEEIPGRHFIGSFCWEFPGDADTALAASIGRVLLAQQRVFDIYTEVQDSIIKASGTENDQPFVNSYLGLVSSEHYPLDVADAALRSIATFANRDLHMLASGYRIPLLPAATDNGSDV